MKTSLWIKRAWKARRTVLQAAVLGMTAAAGIARGSVSIVGCPYTNPCCGVYGPPFFWFNTMIEVSDWSDQRTHCVENPVLILPGGGYGDNGCNITNFTYDASSYGCGTGYAESGTNSAPANCFAFGFFGATDWTIPYALNYDYTADVDWDYNACEGWSTWNISATVVKVGVNSYGFEKDMFNRSRFMTVSPPVDDKTEIHTEIETANHGTDLFGFVEVPPVTFAVEGGMIVHYNLEPLPGMPPGGSFREPLGYVEVTTVWRTNGVFSHDEPPYYLHLGDRELSWNNLGVQANAFNTQLPVGYNPGNGFDVIGEVVRVKIEDFLNEPANVARGLNTNGTGFRIGELITFQVNPARPLYDSSLNVDEYAFQVALKLGLSIGRISLYATSPGFNPPNMNGTGFKQFIVPAGSEGTGINGFTLASAAGCSENIVVTLASQTQTGILTIQNTSGVSVSGNGSATVTVTMTSTLSALVNALNSLVYQSSTVGSDLIVVSASACGSTASSGIPVSVVALGMPPIAAGWYHSLAVTTNGTVRSWGLNSSGQLGDATSNNQPAPFTVTNLDHVIGVAGGSHHSLALKDDGTVRAWGGNSFGELGLGSGTAPTYKTNVAVPGLTDIMNIAAGQQFSLFVKSNGTVWACGKNSNGQLGNGDTNGTPQHSPVAVTNLTGVVQAAAGQWHALAVKSNGEVWAWGHNNVGQLGDGSQTRKFSPVQVTNLSGVIKVAAGNHFSLALKGNGQVWAWGHNGEGQLGDGTPTARITPVQITTLSNIVTIGAGGTTSFAIQSDGTVWAWGGDNEGQLGNDAVKLRKLSPVLVANVAPGSAVATGWSHSLFMKQNGTVWSCGNNTNGQLGRGGAVSPPLQVTGF